VLAHKDFSFSFIDIRARTVKTISNAAGDFSLAMYCLKMAPDGKLVAVCTPCKRSSNCLDDEPALTLDFLVFDPNSLNPIQAVYPMPGSKMAWPHVVLSPDQSTVLIRIFGDTKIWSVAKHSVVGQISAGSRFGCLIWSPDSKAFLATQDRDTLGLYSATGARLDQLPLPAGFLIHALRWPSPDQIILEGVKEDDGLNTVRLIKVHLSKNKLSLGETIDTPGQVDLGAQWYGGADGKGLKMVLHKSGRLRFWDGDSNTLTDIKTYHQSSNSADHFSPDGKYFYLCSDNTVTVYESDTCQLVEDLSARRFALPMHAPSSVMVEWAPDSKTIVVLGDMYTPTVEIVDLPPAK
jgi:WD40 repeat protein